MTAGAVANLAASLGCVRLGILGVGGDVLAMAAGTVVAVRLGKRSR